MDQHILPGIKLTKLCHAHGTITHKYEPNCLKTKQVHNATQCKITIEFMLAGINMFLARLGLILAQAEGKGYQSGCKPPYSENEI